MQNNIFQAYIYKLYFQDHIRWGGGGGVCHHDGSSMSSHRCITAAFPQAEQTSLSEPHLFHSEGEGSGPPDWGTSPYGPVTGSRSSFLGCHWNEETLRGRFFSGLSTDYTNTSKSAWIQQKFKSKTLNRTKQITLINGFPSFWVLC